MREEVQRCQHALAMAGAGKRTAILCSGDAGVYGMAGLVYASVSYTPLDVYKRQDLRL